MIVRFSFVIFSSLIVSSCAFLLPYEEEPLCKIGKEGGYCGSISDVYHHTLNLEVEYKTPVKLEPGVPCDNCDVESYKKKVEDREESKDFQDRYSEKYFGRN